jgi:tetratricopeptide (TPR) repeat protein
MSYLMFRALITFFILIFIASPALAQIDAGQPNSSSRAQIHGQVRYAGGGEPASQIRVRLERFDGGVISEQQTDRSGKFTFGGLRQLIYNVSIHIPGFDDVLEQVELVTKRSDYIILTLRPDKTSRSAPLGRAVVLDAKVPLAARKEFDKGQTAILDKEEPEEGIPHLEKAISLYPNFLEAYLLLGTVYMDAQQLDKAESMLRKATAINPKRPEPLIALGEVYRQQKKYTEAEKELLEGLKIHERSWQGHYSLGRLYYAKDDLPKSGRHVAKTIQLKPDLAEAHLLGANILLRARKAEDALMEFEEYLRLEPNGKFSQQARETISKIKKALAKNVKK